MKAHELAEQLINELCEPEDIKAVETYVEDLAQWVIDAIKGKVASRMKATITEHTNYNPAKLDIATMRQEIGKLTLESAKDRNAREQAEMEARVNKPTTPAGRT